jgi:hypothetical protein
MFQGEREDEAKKSLNYIQYVQPDENQEPATLEELCEKANYAGTETSDKIGKRAREHDNELRNYLGGKILNVTSSFISYLLLYFQPTEKILQMKAAYASGAQIKYIHFNRGSYLVKAYAIESCIIVAFGKLILSNIDYILCLGLHNLSNSMSGKRCDEVFKSWGEGKVSLERMARLGAYHLHKAFAEHF